LQYTATGSTRNDAMKNQPTKIPRPTEAELQILHILWAREACTVRDVYEVLNHEAGVGYTTALKLLQVMHGKGLVKRDDSQRAHVYRAAIGKEGTQKKFVQDMLQRVFEGSPSQLVMHALGSRRASREELSQIRELLNKLDQESR
jgi:predicted transcriptional regulator